MEPPERRPKTRTSQETKERVEMLQILLTAYPRLTPKQKDEALEYALATLLMLLKND